MTTTERTASCEMVNKKTGRRENTSVDGPRINTVCFMLSNNEKLAVDRLAFCLNITRSGVLANIVDEFVTATDPKRGRAGEKRLLELLEKCRGAVKERGALAQKAVVPESDAQ